jgi:glycosyltransferase involved in cell wall biosynthesis
LKSIRAAAECVEDSVFLVVVADACSDDTALVAEPWADAVIRSEAGCVGAARRTGCALALSEGCRWLANTDADGRVPEHWLAHQTGRAADVVCGTVALGASRWVGAEARLRYAEGYRAEDGHRHIHGANLGISALAYRTLGGFPALPCHEDVALVERAVQEGVPVAWTAGAPVSTSARLNARAPHGFAAHLRRLADPSEEVLQPWTDGGIALQLA